MGEAARSLNVLSNQVEEMKVRFLHTINYKPAFVYSDLSINSNFNWRNKFSGKRNCWECKTTHSAWRESSNRKFGWGIQDNAKWSSSWKRFEKVRNAWKIAGKSIGWKCSDRTVSYFTLNWTNYCCLVIFLLTANFVVTIEFLF